jgi:hypothetical protein
MMTERADGMIVETRTIDVDGVPVTFRSHRAPCIDARTREAIDALMAAAYRQFAPIPEPTAFRPDGWPLCPRCGEDELWSPIWNSDRPRPSLDEFLAGPLACYACGWRRDALLGREAARG